MFKSILVPLDGSKRAERILSHVEQLAMQFKSSLMLLRVVEPSLNNLGTYGTSADFYLKSLELATQEAQDYLSSMQGELRKMGVSTKTILEKGPVVNVIIAVAAREQVSLVAMASHGRTGLSRAFYGSVAAGVLNRIDRPLLLVRADE